MALLPLPVSCLFGCSRSRKNLHECGLLLLLRCGRTHTALTASPVKSRRSRNLTAAAYPRRRWTSASGGDGEWYEAEVKSISETHVNFTFMQSSDWNAFDESVLLADIGPERVRELQKRRSKRSKKAVRFLGIFSVTFQAEHFRADFCSFFAAPFLQLKFSYADLESGLVMRRKDSAEFSEMLLSDDAKFQPDTVPRIDGATLTAELLKQQGFRTPMVARTVQSIGGTIPEKFSACFADYP